MSETGLAGGATRNEGLVTAGGSSISAAAGANSTGLALERNASGGRQRVGGKAVNCGFDVSLSHG